MTTPIEPFPLPTEPQEPMSWLDMWGYALTSPSVKTYEEILADPKAQKTPYLWIALATIIAYLITIGAQALFGAAIVPSSTVYSLICGVPIAVISGLLGFYIAFGFQHLLARLLGGTGTWQEYGFAVAAFYIPLIILSPLVGFLISVLSSGGIVAMVLGYIPSAILSIYSIILNINAMRAAHKFGTGKALLAVLVIPGAIVGIFSCLIVYLLIQMGTSVMDIINTYSNGITY